MLKGVAKELQCLMQLIQRAVQATTDQSMLPSIPNKTSNAHHNSLLHTGNGMDVNKILIS